MKKKTLPSPPARSKPDSAAAPAVRSRRIARWRAFSLSLVYLLFAAHIIHWKTTGRTLAPLELNEVMYTLELGIVTAGFLFMCFLVLGTLIFGRFFCSWACHIMVLQDLCAWLLRKAGIRRKPIRSRLLLLVPPLTAFYMFVWPQVLRAWHSRALPTFHFRTDAEGWASFATTNFWRNLPSPPIIVLTFLVCGFFIVYLLGSRTFCTYVCPYGAIFALADRFALGRIRVNDKCRQCGTCTAVCTSGVRVHEEVKTHGIVVNSACLKDFDCVAACPERALSYAFAGPSLLKSLKSGGRFGRQPYDFTPGEELLMAAVFIFTTLTFRGLYGRIPFLLSLAFGAITAYLTVIGVRLARRSSVQLATLTLKDSGRLSLAGRVFAVSMVPLIAVSGHSAFVRYHEYSGLSRAMAMNTATGQQDRERLAASALAHLAAAERWGLLRNERVERILVDVWFELRRYDDAQARAARLLARAPDDVSVRLRLGQCMAASGRFLDAERQFRAVAERASGDEAAARIASHARQALGELLAREGRYADAAEELRTALRLDPSRAAVHAELAGVLAEVGRIDEAIAGLREAIRLEPALAQAQYNLGTLLAGKRMFDEAIRCYRQALAGGMNDADLHNNLGFALWQTGRAEESQRHFEKSLALDPRNANTHFNLGNLFSRKEDRLRAAEHYRMAARLDSRFAGLLTD